jgi:hypothetical protein
MNPAKFMKKMPIYGDGLLLQILFSHSYLPVGFTLMPKLQKIILI